MKLFDTMTLPQLHSAILEDNEKSQKALWYLLHERMKQKLWMCYNLYFKDRGEECRSFDDYLNDFYIYLYSYTPANMLKPVHYLVLRRLEDNTRLDPYLQQTFKQYLQKQIVALDQQLKEAERIKAEKMFLSLPEVQYDMQQIGYAIALLNLHETPLNRYIFFRAISHKVIEDDSIVGYPPDEDIAEVIGLTYNAYRIRSSRMFEQLRDIMRDMENKKLAALDANSILLIRKICGSDSQLNNIVKKLLCDSEAQLPKDQYKQILSMRRNRPVPPRCSMTRFKLYTEEQICRTPDDFEYGVCKSRILTPAEMLEEAKQRKAQRRAERIARKKRAKEQRIRFAQKISKLFLLM